MRLIRLSDVTPKALTAARRLEIAAQKRALKKPPLGSGLSVEEFMRALWWIR